MALSRRSFLQTLGLTVVSLGAIDSVSQASVRQVIQALTQFQGRKFALLIGIDHYPNVVSLAGCGQDLRIQRNLLIHRFGFASGDIFSLQDQQATRENIFTAFQKQLKDLLQPEDFLFVHFSGYGARVPAGEATIPAIIPADGGSTNQKLSVNQAIAVETIEGFMRSLNPAQSVLVLDTSFDPVTATDHHYWRSRTYPKPITVGLNPSEVATEEQIQRNLLQRGLGRKQILRLMAAMTGWAAEGQFNGSSTGLFTAVLAQYLWSINPTATMQAAEIFLTTHYQQQDAERRGFQLDESKTDALYGILPIATVPAVGNVVDQEGNALEVFLGGFEPEILQAIATGSELITLDETQRSLPLTGKSGLFGQVKTTKPVPPIGTRLGENKRFLPRNLTLKIALGNNLSRIERVDATSAFAGAVSVANVSNPQEWADYVFDAGYQLFSVTGKALPGLLPVEANEAIRSSVTRLQPRFEQLLALKWLRLLMNETTSQVALGISLNRSLGKTMTSLVETIIPLNLGRSPNFTQPKIQFSDELAYRFNNNGTHDLYCVGFAQSPKQELFLLTPKTGLTLTPAQKNLDFAVEPMRLSGTWKIYWIAGDRPFTNFQAQLEKLFGDLETTPQKLEKPLPLLEALLTDLHDASLVTNENNKELYALSTQNWAGLQFMYEAVETK